MEEEKKVVEATTTEKEGSKFGWGVLGFFFPLVGLILFLVWLKDKKKAAKAAGIGALIGFILNIIVTVLAFTGVISIFTLAGEPVIDVKPNTDIVEDKKEETTIDARTRDCEGTMAQDGYRYDMLYDSNSQKDCKTITYKPNDDFTIKRVYKKSEDNPDSYTSSTYINDVEYNIFANENKKLYISGKTLVVGIMNSATEGTSLINTSGELYSVDTEGKYDKSYEVDSNGNLVITAFIFTTDGTDLLADVYNDNSACALSLEEVANAYGLSPDDDLITSYTFELNDNGLFNVNYSKRETVKTIREAYNQLCNR